MGRCGCVGVGWGIGDGRGGQNRNSRHGRLTPLAARTHRYQKHHQDGHLNESVLAFHAEPPPAS